MIEKTKRKAQKECIWCDVKNENGCMLRPVKDPATGDFMGYIACEVIDKCPKWEKVKSDIEAITIKKDKEEKDGERESLFKDLFEKNNKPKPLQIDEVAYAYFNQVRVNSWNILSNDYAGHKVGALYAFVLKLIEEHITESVNPVLRHSVEDVKNNFIELPHDYIFNGLKPPKEDK